MTITRIFRLGTPYHWRAMKPARSGKSDASKLGTVHAGAACSEDGCQITAAAPRADHKLLARRLNGLIRRNIERAQGIARNPRENRRSDPAAEMLARARLV